MKHLAPPTQGSIERLEQRIAPAASLAVSVVSIDLNDAVPGQSGSVKFKLTNSGDEASSGKSGLHLWMSKDATIGAGDAFLSEFEDQSIAVPAHGSKTFSKSFKLPDLDLPNPSIAAGSYQIIVQYVFVGSAPSQPFNYVFKFGTVGSHSNVSLPFTSADLNGKFILNGNGTGELALAGGTVDVTITGTDDKTRAGVAGNGHIPLRNITVSSPLSLLNMLPVNVTGNVNLPGGVGSLGFNDVGGGTTFSIGPSLGGKAVKMKLGHVHDIALTSQGGIDTLKLIDWQNANANPDSITAPFLQKLDDDGDFEASLNLNGNNGKGFAIDNVKVDGVLGGIWTITGAGNNVRKIVADGGSMWKLLVDGNVDTLDIKGDLLGDRNSAAIKAHDFDGINVAGTLAIYNEATDKAADSFGIENVRAKRGDGATVRVSNGGISKIAVGEWINGGAITTQFLKILTSDGSSGAGDFSANLTITPPATLPSGVKASLGKATIDGALKGSTSTAVWDIGGLMSSLTAGSIASDWKLEGNRPDGADATNLDKLDINGAVAGTLKLHTLGPATVDGEFTGKLQVKSVFTLKLGTVSLGVIEALGEIDSVAAVQWTGGHIDAANFNAITITGRTKDSLPGNFSNVSIHTTGSDSDGTLKVAGGMASVSILATSSVTAIIADDWINGSLDAPSLSFFRLGGSSTTRGDLSNVNVMLTRNFGAVPEVEIAGLIDSSTFNSNTGFSHVKVGGMNNSTITSGSNMQTFEVKGADGLNAPLFVASNVNVAGKIDGVIVREVGTGGSSFGFSADTITSYTRIAGAVSTALHELTAAGDYDQLANYRVHIT